MTSVDTLATETWMRHSGRCTTCTIAIRQLGAVLALLIATCPAVARAQSLTDSSSHISVPITAWASVGIGPGHVNAPANNAVAGLVRVAVSTGPVVLTYRWSDAGPFIGAGSGVRSDAVLVGGRTRGRRAFASAALGYARAAPYHDCDQCGVETVDPGVSALAFDLSVHANFIVPGIAVSFSGNVGPARAAYSALSVELELGWFGR